MCRHRLSGGLCGSEVRLMDAVFTEKRSAHTAEAAAEAALANPPAGIFAYIF